MALQHGLFTLALSALFLVPVAAKADNFRHEASPVGPPRYESHQRGYRPAPPPPMPVRPRGAPSHGRYELQTVQREVPGYYENVWVERMCTTTRRGRVIDCVPGHNERRWVPGYLQSVQEWVWVPYYSRYGRG